MNTKTKKKYLGFFIFVAIYYIASLLQATLLKKHGINTQQSFIFFLEVYALPFFVGGIAQIVSDYLDGN